MWGGRFCVMRVHTSENHKKHLSEKLKKKPEDIGFQASEEFVALKHRQQVRPAGERRVETCSFSFSCLGMCVSIYMSRCVCVIGPSAPARLDDLLLAARLRVGKQRNSVCARVR
jgi:hypothetical protein